jgi:hypothetical protein
MNYPLPTYKLNAFHDQAYISIPDYGVIYMMEVDNFDTNTQADISIIAGVVLGAMAMWLLINRTK